jgi:hypothetical protein
MSPTSEFMLSLVPDARGLATHALLQLVEIGIAEANDWPDEAFKMLNEREFETTLEPWPRIRRFAIALDEICRRKARLQPAEREQLLKLLKPRPEALQRAKIFLGRLAPDIGVIRALQATHRANSSHRQRLDAAGFTRVMLTVPVSQVAAIKKIAADMVAADGTLPPPGPRGRPRKQ